MITIYFLVRPDSAVEKLWKKPESNYTNTIIGSCSEIWKDIDGFLQLLHIPVGITAYNLNKDSIDMVN